MLSAQLARGERKSTPGFGSDDRGGAAGASEARWEMESREAGGGGSAGCKRKRGGNRWDRCAMRSL